MGDWKSKINFAPGEPIYSRDMNGLAYDVRYWGGNVDACGNYFLNVRGIECQGDINVSGTFRINGVPITAFRPIPEKIIEKTIEPKIIEHTVERFGYVSAGDNITVEAVGDTLQINSDPGNWIEYTPSVNVPTTEAGGQYIVYGPICFVQIYVALEEVPQMGKILVSLPYSSYGSVKQSLGSGVIEGVDVVLDPAHQLFINGSYRVA
jgi:hypothetical protein